MAAVWCSLEIMDLDTCLLTLHLHNVYDKSLVMSEHYTLWGCVSISLALISAGCQLCSLIPGFFSVVSSLGYWALCSCTAVLAWAASHFHPNDRTDCTEPQPHSVSIKVAKQAGNPRLPECPIKQEGFTSLDLSKGWCVFSVGLTAVASNQTILVFRKFYFWKQENSNSLRNLCFDIFMGRIIFSSGFSKPSYSPTAQRQMSSRNRKLVKRRKNLSRSVWILYSYELEWFSASPCNKIK